MIASLQLAKLHPVRWYLWLYKECPFPPDSPFPSSMATPPMVENWKRLLTWLFTPRTLIYIHIDIYTLSVLAPPKPRVVKVTS